MLLHIEHQQHVEHMQLEPEDKAEALAAVLDMAAYEHAAFQQRAQADYFAALARHVPEEHRPNQLSAIECWERAQEHSEAGDQYDSATDTLSEWLCELSVEHPGVVRPRFPDLEENA